MDAKIASDETAVITAGMVITGDVSSEGSMDLVGTCLLYTSRCV